jgi:hypothetical protein
MNILNVFPTQSDEEEAEVWTMDGDSGDGSKAQVPEKGTSNNNSNVCILVWS